MKTDNLGTIKLLSALSFVLMITVNALANILPINGVGAGEVSDSYPNLFAPAGLTFSIWGLIYLLLTGFVLYTLGVFGGHSGSRDEVARRAGPYFIISSLANAAWIFAWHYRVIPLSVVLIAVILISLIAAYRAINASGLSRRDLTLVKLPFSVYFGWITVATVANVTTLLVSVGWNGSGISESAWTAIVLVTGLLIGGLTTIRYRDIAYGLVIVWAYTGILIKHLSPEAFGGRYPDVITTVEVSLALLVIAILYVAFGSARREPALS